MTESAGGKERDEIMQVELAQIESVAIGAAAEVDG